MNTERNLITILSKMDHNKGVLYVFETNNGLQIKILFLYHSIWRAKKWNLTEAQIGETLVFPEEVLVGHNNRFIAHRRYSNHLIRCVYEYDNNLPVLITLYFPYSERYFKGGVTFENKIFKGS